MSCLGYNSRCLTETILPLDNQPTIVDAFGKAKATMKPRKAGAVVSSESDTDKATSKKPAVARAAKKTTKRKPDFSSSEDSDADLEFVKKSTALKVCFPSSYLFSPSPILQDGVYFLATGPMFHHIQLGSFICLGEPQGKLCMGVGICLHSEAFFLSSPAHFHCIFRSVKSF